jgi:hypothetical protein
MSSEAQVALVTGLFTVAGILTGAVVGWLLNRSSQAHAEKRAALVEFLAAMDACQHNSLSLHIALRNPVLRTQEFERARAAQLRIDTARTVAALVLPPTARTILDSAVMACVTEFTNASKTDWDGTTVIPQEWEQVLALAKSELGYR